MDVDELILVDEMAREMRVSRMTVYRLLNDGTIPSFRFGRSFRVRRADFDEYIHASSGPVSLRHALDLLANGWEGQYHVLHSDSPESEMTYDEVINEALAETYLENAEHLRALLKEHE